MCEFRLEFLSYLKKKKKILRERDLKVLRKMNLCTEREKEIRLLQLRSYGDSSETGVYMCDFFFFFVATAFSMGLLPSSLNVKNKG